MSADRYVLVSAHHCAPAMGSEHAVGWNLVRRLAISYPILLITQDNEFRAAVEQGVAALRGEGCRIEAFYVRHSSRTDGRKNNLRLFYYITYVAYQRRVLALARELQSRFAIGLVHHLTIVGFREPGFLWQLGVPFVWGPVGGLVYAPHALFGELTPKMKLFQHLRNAATWLQFRFGRRVRSAYAATQRRGGAFIAATPDIGERFQLQFGGRFVWIPETGSGVSVAAAPSLPREGPLRLMWAGGLLDIKPLGLLLDAIARVPGHADRISLRVIGDGDARSRYEEKAARLGVSARFEGWLSHERTLDLFRGAELFVLFSAKDLTTNVVFEALGSGVPVMCLDHHGYSFIVNEQCGIKLPLQTLERLRDSIARSLESLLSDRHRLDALATGAVRRAAEFTWDRNAQALGALYEEAISGASSPSNP